MSERFNLRHLKHAVSIEQVLADRGRLRHLRRRGRQLVGPCPVHDGDNIDAFVVDPGRNIWRCFTRCSGGVYWDGAMFMRDF